MMGFISSSFMPLMLLILMDLPEIGSRYMGSAGGIFFCIAEIGGFAGPLIMGVLVDITGTFLLGAFFLASLCVGICILTLFLRLGSEKTS
jgi:MFS family permease